MKIIIEEFLQGVEILLVNIENEEMVQMRTIRWGDKIQGVSSRVDVTFLEQLLIFVEKMFSRRVNRSNNLRAHFLVTRARQRMSNVLRRWLSDLPFLRGCVHQLCAIDWHPLMSSFYFFFLSLSFALVQLDKSRKGKDPQISPLRLRALLKWIRLLNHVLLLMTRAHSRSVCYFSPPWSVMHTHTHVRVRAHL